jgi:2-polyprenyl-3-methyl-5-hydroxy-6-metoxy-1,4-benzoquinol methylase
MQPTLTDLQKAPRTTLSEQTTDWEDDWDAFEESFRLNPGQMLRRQEIFRALQKRLPTLEEFHVLDVGSGTGDLAREISQKFPQAKIAGLELSKAGIAISQKKVPSANFHLTDLNKTQDPPESLRGWATHATCSEMLEHFDYPELVLRNIRPYLAIGSTLIVTVPAGPISAFHRYIGHRRHYTSEMLKSVLESAGFEILEMRRPGFPFFNLHRMLVLMRGESLSKDISFEKKGLTQFLARIALHCFSALFSLNFNWAGLGWQLVATARMKRYEVQPAAVAPEDTTPLHKEAESFSIELENSTTSLKKTSIEA